MGGETQTDGWKQEPDEVKLEINHLSCLKKKQRVQYFGTNPKENGGFFHSQCLEMKTGIFSERPVLAKAQAST